MPYRTINNILTAYQEQVALRATYALHAVGGRRGDGGWDFGCRAMSLLGSLRCDLKPQSLVKPPTVRRPTTDPTAPLSSRIRSAMPSGAQPAC